MEFITKLEHHVISIEQFQNTELYLNFIQKWNLPVYYQIRFQEIGKLLHNYALLINLGKGHFPKKPSVYRRI